MAYPDDLSKLRNHIAELERRLERYHEGFESSVEQRNRLSLEAAWGVTNAVCGAMAFLSLFYVASYYFGLSGFWLGLVAGVGGSIVQMIAFTISDRGRVKDIGKQQAFPKWESRADDVWE